MVACHGLHPLDNGNIIMFQNPFGPRELKLTAGAGTTLTTSVVWSYTVADTGSDFRGDVQRLPNGNTLVTFSTDGVMHEVSPSGEVIQAIAGATFGYTNFRETLYGPPLPY